jgi:hypothetical protein
MTEFEVGPNVYAILIALIGMAGSYIAGHKQGCKHERKKIDKESR